MPEMLEAFDRDGNILKVDERRILLNEAREYSREHGDAPFAVKAVFLILQRSDGRLIVTRRAKDKKENPGMLDKTVGGHVTADEEFYQALLREAKEEVGINVTICEPHMYPVTTSLVNLKEKAVVRVIDFNSWRQSLRKNADGSIWHKRWRTLIYGGTYDGPVNFEDGECEGVEYYSLSQLLNDTCLRQQMTFDLFSLIKDYAIFLQPNR